MKRYVIATGATRRPRAEEIVAPARTIAISESWRSTNVTNLQTLKPANLTPKQAQAAARFSAQHGAMTVSQAAKWLNYIFALKKREITLERLS